MEDIPLNVQVLSSPHASSQRSENQCKKVETLVTVSNKVLHLWLMFSASVHETGRLTC